MVLYKDINCNKKNTMSKQANTSVFIDPKLKLEAKIFCANNEMTLRELISVAVSEHIKNSIK